MKEWTRAAVDTRCGGPHTAPLVVKRGDPILMVQAPGVTRRLWRCPSCAGEAPPLDLPDLPEHVELTAIEPMLKMRHVRDALPLDFRQARTGDREPGEDG